MWYQRQQHPVKGQPQRRRRIMQMKRTRQQWKVRGPLQHHLRVSRQRESWSHRVAHTQYSALCESCVRERGRNAEHNLLAVEQDQDIDDVPVDYAFLGEHDQTAKLLVILREHQCRWAEELLVQNKGRLRRPSSSVRCRHGTTNGTTETRLQVNSRAIDSGFEGRGCH